MTRRPLLLLVLLASASAAFAQATPSAPPSPDAAACAALLGLNLDNLREAPTRILVARLVDVPTPPPNASRESLGSILKASPIAQYCQVTGFVAPQNKFELRLPLAKDWNQKFFFALCAGFCGGVEGNSCNLSLARGYAAVTSNGGHDGRPGFDGVWAANAPNLQTDFAHRSTHVVTLAAKAIITGYYGRPIARSYISGCSKGGHGALMEAQRYPHDFDGVIAGAPVYDWTGQMALSTWLTQAVSDGKGGSVLDSAAIRTMHTSILAACGAQAGVDEGLVTDPASCAWRPERAACPPNGAATECLTPRQVAAIAKMLTKPNVGGRVLYPGAFVLGAETDAAFWLYDPRNAAGTENTGHFLAPQQFLSYMAQPTFTAVVDPRRVDLARMPAMLARARPIYDATSPDLRAFEARGGKVIVWHGLSDAAVSAASTVVYHERVTKMMGGRAKTDAFFRLFLLPGVNHCSGGPGPDTIDAITALERWVEQGIAPDEMIARRVRNGVVERSRPAYPYPALAKYSGSGDPMKAESFVRKGS